MFSFIFIHSFIHSFLLRFEPSSVQKRVDWVESKTIKKVNKSVCRTMTKTVISFWGKTGWHHRLPHQLTPTLVTTLPLSAGSSRKRIFWALQLSGGFWLDLKLKATFGDTWQRLLITEINYVQLCRKLTHAVGSEMELRLPANYAYSNSTLANYSVSQIITWCQIFAITSSTVNRYLKVFHCWKRMNYLQNDVTFWPPLENLAVLPCET